MNSRSTFPSFSEAPQNLPFRTESRRSLLARSGGNSLSLRSSSFLFILAIILVSVLLPSQSSAQQPPLDHHTVYYLHGRFYTNDPEHPWAAALAVRDAKILCVGSLAHILLDCGGSDENAETVQLHNNFVLPGFNDAHVHLGGAGRDFLSLRLNGVDSIAELQKRVKAAASGLKQGEWLVGRGWDQTLWPDRKFPTRQQLDEAAPKNPVYLEHISGHVAVVNSLALKHAEIVRETPNPSGGEIERDADGEATGLLKEDAKEMALQRIPDPSPEDRRKGIELVLAEFAKNGVTSVQDNSEWEDFLVYQQLKEEKKLTVRITEWLHFTQPLGELQNLRSEGGTSDPWLKTGALKMVTDGALGSHTASMLAPYSDDPSTSGILIMDPEKLKALAIERDKAGFQLAFHAIGDRANRIALDVFEAVANANGPRDRRDRIEHAQVIAPEDFPRFAKLGVIASMQPSHETNDLRWAELLLGPHRAKGAYAWATLLKNGVKLAFGTDYDVEPINPFRGLYACVTREAVGGGPVGGWQPQEKISLDDCIRAYTSGSAYAQFEEGKKGELKVGEYADFIVLSHDITKIPAPEILKTQVLRTIVGGRLVYQKN
jgi:predicted amidohydrolase YtcJ